MSSAIAGWASACHQTQVAAETVGLPARAANPGSKNVRSGDRAPESDLYPQIIAGLEGLEEFARESFYDIDWDEKILIYRGQE
jgi:hypothetical protein